MSAGDIGGRRPEARLDNRAAARRREREIEPDEGDFDERGALREAVDGGAFWGTADASAAVDALKWGVFAGRDAWSWGLLALWRQYIGRRLALISAITRRGLDRGAFRHPKHAANALRKHQRGATGQGDFIESWQQEVERRISASAALSRS